MFILLQIYQDAPKAVSASVNPSGEIHEGSSVTLICNSDANPQVHNHTWYKMTASESVLVGSEKNLPIPDITMDDAGMYYCTATNELGEVNSSMMVIKVTGKNNLQPGYLQPSQRLVQLGWQSGWL